MNPPLIKPADCLRDVKYEIRGPLAQRALQMEQSGYEIVKLNIGNPGAFGFRMPDTMRRAMVENLHQADPYCHQKGIFPAREAVVMQQQERGVMDVSVDDVFIGNGVSELIMLAMRGLVNEGDEVLVPSPDYPLWTASVVIHGGKAVHYPCREENSWAPSVDEVAKLITPRTKALVIINPNNPTGAVYPKSVLEGLVRLAEQHHLVVMADEIYDQITYDGAEFVPLATLVKHTLCVTYGGLSKVYRACGMRVGWAVFSGERDHAREYMQGLDLLASLRLCSNVPGQWAVQTALGGYQSIKELTSPGGRLYETRQVLLEHLADSPFLRAVPPAGALYAFVRVDTSRLPDFDDHQFALQLLESKHILVCPGRSFNVPYAHSMRITLLPEAPLMRKVLGRIDEFLEEMVS